MGKLMTWLKDHVLGHARQSMLQERHQRIEEVQGQIRELSSESQQLKATVRKFQQADDPLAELVRTLRSSRQGRPINGGHNGK